MSVSDHATVIRRIVDEAWNKGDLSVIDELLAEGYVNHTPGPGEGSDRAAFKQAIAATRAAFPDLQITIDDLLIAGDKAATRWTARGTHRGEFRGIPATGSTIATSGITIDRLVNGQSVEQWQYGDDLAMLQQLGVLPG